VAPRHSYDAKKGSDTWAHWQIAMATQFSNRGFSPIQMLRGKGGSGGKYACGAP
jgi:hypothetical protein